MAGSREPPGRALPSPRRVRMAGSGSEQARGEKESDSGYILRGRVDRIF